MSRTPIAIAAGLIFLAAYLISALALADLVLGSHWLVQAAFFVVAGSLWVLPVYRLMQWALRPGPLRK
jgi:hypothetical protein